jgi:hypothetical protein
MSKVKIQGNASGTGVLTIAAPNTNTDRTIGLPDTTGTLLDENSSVPAANLTGTVADARISALTASKLTGALPAISGAALTGITTGKVLQQQRVYLTSATQLTSSGAMHELSTSLRVSITPNHANNFLLLECSAWYCSPNTDGLTFAKFFDVTNTAMAFPPPNDGSREKVHFAQRVKSYDVNDFHTMNFRATGTAGNTNARTYTIHHRTEIGTMQFLQSALSSSSGVTAPIVFTVTEIEV